LNADGPRLLRGVASRQQVRGAIPPRATLGKNLKADS
jgi:hypothetical protein